VTFGFVVAALVAAWLLGATLGGWKFGSFFRQVELHSTIWSLLLSCSACIGVLRNSVSSPLREAEEFTQGGAHFEDVGATPKLLRVDNSASARAKVQVALTI
jgi:hypothetical protein